MKEILETEFSEEFVEKMRNAMVMSYFKYGKVALNFPSKIDAVDSLFMQINKYLRSGNKEYLIGIANYAMIEFMTSKNEYKGTDVEGSAGRMEVTGVKEAVIGDDDVVDKLRQRYRYKDGD